MNCARQLWFSIAPAVRFHDVTHPVSTGPKMLWQSGVHNVSFSVRVTIVITTSWQNVCAVGVCICPLLCFSLRVVSPCLLSLCKCLVVFCPRSKKGVPSCCSLPNRQTDLCSNLCSTPVCSNHRSVRPRERWVISAYATWPKLGSTPGIQATLLYAGLTLAGAMRLQNFWNHVVLQEGSFGKTMTSWRVIVAQYASAIQL